jgi:predicted transposase YdaD
MPKPYDAATKWLVDVHPQDWLRLLGVVAEDVEPFDVELVDSDLATVTSVADRVFRVKQPEESLYHLELETGHHGSEKAHDLLNFSVLTTRKYRLPVETSVVLLRREADSPSLTGFLDYVRKDGTSYLRFEYNVVRLWEIPVEQLLTGGIGTLPLPPLARVKPNQLPTIVRRMQKRIESEAATELGELWTATKVLMGLRYSRELTNRLLKGVREMRDSVTYQEILEEGEARGELRGERHALFHLGERRLGDASQRVKDTVNAIASSEQLLSLLERVAAVETWDELLSGIN